jgi:peptide/nickel transport system permease protein
VALRRLARDPGAVAGAAVVLIVAICAIFAPLIARTDPNLQNLGSTLVPPMWMAGGSGAHPLGTDNLGRDLLTRIIWGSRVSAIVGPGLWTVIAAIGLTSWVQYVRVVRAETLSLREREFIAAAEAAGATSPGIVTRHLLPNVASVAIVLGTFEIARAVVFESSLSFLGLGVPPTTPSWGGMLADGRQYLDTAWWVALFPGLAIMIAVMGVNLLGDGLRDALDPSAR